MKNDSDAHDKKILMELKPFPYGQMFQSDLLAKEFGRVRYRLELYDMAR